MSFLFHAVLSVLCIPYLKAPIIFKSCNKSCETGIPDVIISQILGSILPQTIWTIHSQAMYALKQLKSVVNNYNTKLLSKKLCNLW